MPKQKNTKIQKSKLKVSYRLKDINLKSSFISDEPVDNLDNYYENELWTTENSLELLNDNEKGLLYCTISLTYLFEDRKVVNVVVENIFFVNSLDKLTSQENWEGLIPTMSMMNRAIAQTHGVQSQVLKDTRFENKLWSLVSAENFLKKKVASE